MVQEHAAARSAREEEVYRRYAPAVFTYLLRHIPIHQDAEDLLVEVFLAVLEKLPLLDIDEKRLAAYVQTVARNKMADYYRKRGKWQIVPLEAIMEIAYEPTELAPEQLVLAGEELANLRQAFGALPAQQQTILRLRFAHGLCSRDIAAHLSKKESAVRVMLSRALKFLRKHHALADERN
ncbi:MAG: RNA polymerase sigma factor [Ktedonobacteraceae bacterium]